MTHTVTITIGRNDGPLTRERGAAVPMPPAEWAAFQDRVTTQLTVRYGSAFGVGSWDGIDEETFMVVGQVEDLGALRAALAAAAAEFRQDAVGLIAQQGLDTEVRCAA